MEAERKREGERMGEGVGGDTRREGGCLCSER